MTLQIRDATNAIKNVKSTTRALGEITHTNQDVDYITRVARGDEAGAQIIRVMGVNSAVDTTAENVWSAGATWTKIASSAIAVVTSSSANDTAAGTGARTVQISGLNGSGAAVTETVTLNGTSNVNSVNSYTFINSLTVLTAGSGLTNAGVITATVGTVQARIETGTVVSTDGMYTVPAGNVGFIRAMSASSQGGIDMRFTLYRMSSGILYPIEIMDTFNVPVSRLLPSIPVSANQTVLVRAQRTSSTGAVPVYASFELLLLSASL